MPSKGEFLMICLWEDEVRLAAKAFAEVSRVYADEAATHEQRADALGRAVNAGICAFAGAEDDECALMISRKPLICSKRRKRA